MAGRWLRVLLSEVPKNWRCGLWTALVNLPWSAGLAVACGARPETGVISAVVGGLLAAVFGDCDFAVVAPTVCFLMLRLFRSA
jgi:SulP family sulfate permease